jgi:hypothetical protein
MGQVLDVRISHLRSFPGLHFLSHPHTRGRRCNHITFVQVYTASLAWAPFNAGCDEPGGRPRPACSTDIRSTW